MQMAAAHHVMIYRTYCHLMILTTYKITLINVQMVKLFHILALMGNGILILRKTIVLLLPAAHPVS